MTGDLGDALRSLAQRRGDHLAPVTPPADVRRSIGRRRRLRTGVMAVATVAVLGVVGAASVPAVLDTVAAPSVPDPTLSVTERVVAMATVPFDQATSINDSVMDDAVAWCGQSLPAPSSAGDEFTATFDARESDTPPSVGIMNVRLDYAGAENLHATLSPLVALFAREGVVVGFSVGYEEPGLVTFNAGGGMSRRWANEGIWNAQCPEDGHYPERGLPAGDYETVWTIGVLASEVANAQAELWREGYVIPTAEELEIFREGSYDCRARLSWSEQIPITCDPTALGDTVIDLEAGTVTFPYRADAYDRDVDVRLTSEPATVTLGDEFSDNWWIEYEETNPEYVPGTPLACGDQFRTGYGGVQLALETDLTGLERGAVVDIEAWSVDQDWSELSLELPTGPRAWILESMEVVLEQDNGTVATSVDRVVGWLDLSLPGQLDLVRYDGPRVFEAEVLDVGWCDGQPHPDQVTGAAIIDPYTVTDADGTRAIDQPVVVSRWSSW